MSALIPIDQREVDFYGDHVVVVVADVDGERMALVPLRPIAEALGVDWASQWQRTRRNVVLSEVMQTCVVMTTTQRREMAAIPLDYLNGWLFGIDARRVRDDLREKVMSYQRECYRVLAGAFGLGGAIIVDAPTDSGAAQALQILRAQVQLAEAQVAAEGRIQALEAGSADFDERIGRLERALGDGERRVVTETQASQLSQAVKAVAVELGKKSGRNEFGGVYGELYRRFGITSYKQLPADEFAKAMEWLTGWHQDITGEPF